jgi:hypothetical protein
MILYHGTTENLGVKIIQDKEIKNQVKRIYNDDIATTDGLVYLSNLMSGAIDFGNRNAIQNRENYIYIFECLIDEKELLPDYDEINPSINPSIELKDPFEVQKFDPPKSMEWFNSVTIARNLLLPEDVKRYKILPSTVNYIDNHRDITVSAIRSRKRKISVIEELNSFPWINI